ncbi:MAG: hypothetical protein HOL16_05005 [Alphaproteobacteria bacterium]|nr:hypothetical protein [Alphaproteobacteria bacterium]
MVNCVGVAQAIPNVDSSNGLDDGLKDVRSGTRSKKVDFGVSEIAYIVSDPAEEDALANQGRKQATIDNKLDALEINMGAVWNRLSELVNSGWAADDFYLAKARVEFGTQCSQLEKLRRLYPKSAKKRAILSLEQEVRMLVEHREASALGAIGRFIERKHYEGFERHNGHKVTHDYIFGYVNGKFYPSNPMSLETFDDLYVRALAGVLEEKGPPLNGKRANPQVINVF